MQPRDPCLPWRGKLLDGITDSMDMSLSELRELVMLSNHLILCHPLLLLPSMFPNINTQLDEGPETP